MLCVSWAACQFAGVHFNFAIIPYHAGCR